MEIVILGPVLIVSRLSFQIEFDLIAANFMWDQIPPINLEVPLNQILVWVPPVINVTVIGKFSMKTIIQSSTTKFTSEFLCPVPPGAVLVPEARPPPPFPAAIEVTRQNRVVLLPDLLQADPAVRIQHPIGRIISWLMAILVAGGLFVAGVQFTVNPMAFSGNSAPNTLRGCENIETYLCARFVPFQGTGNTTIFLQYMTRPGPHLCALSCRKFSILVSTPPPHPLNTYSLSPRNATDRKSVV